MSRSRLRNPACKLTNVMETSEQRRDRLNVRRASQRALLPGVLKANLMDTMCFDEKGRPKKRLLAMPVQKLSKYMPHQGVQECARRAGHAARLALRGQLPQLAAA